MRIANVVISIICAALLLLLVEWMPEPQKCSQIEYKQRGRLQLLTVCEDTLYDTGTAHQYKQFQDSIQVIRSEWDVK